MAREQLTPAATAALAYWPQIEYAAAAGLNTADLWASIHEAAEEIGLETPGVSVQGVSQLRAIAVGIQRKGAELAGLADSKRLSGRNVTIAPWARSAGERRALPKLSVRYEHTYFANGEVQTSWRTSMFDRGLPRTLGQLRRDINADATNLSNKYNVQNIDTGSLQILAV